MSSKDWPRLVKSGQIEKLKISDLKEYLKDHGISQAGEKGTLIFRIKSHLDGEKLKVEG